MVSAKRGPRPADDPPSCQTCATRSRAEWCVLSDEEMAQVDRARTTWVFQRGQHLYQEGSVCAAAFCIYSGTVVQSRPDPHGVMMPLRLLHAGETAVTEGLEGAALCSSRATALRTSVICRIELEPMRVLLDMYPHLRQRFHESLVRRLQQTEAQVLANAALPVRARLADLLLRLREHYGRHVPGSGQIEIALPMSRRETAALLGTRPETLARAIAALQADGVASFQGRLVRAPSAQRLAEEIHPPTRQCEAAD